MLTLEAMMDGQKTSHTASINVLAIPVVCTIEEAADLLRRKSATGLYPLLEAGMLKSTVVGGKRLITGESIAELLRNGEQQTYEPMRVSPNPAAKQRKNASGDKVCEVA